MRVCIPIEDFLLCKAFFLPPESVTWVRDIPVNFKPLINGRQVVLTDVLTGVTLGYFQLQTAAFKGRNEVLSDCQAGLSVGGPPNATVLCRTAD